MCYGWGSRVAPNDPGNSLGRFDRGKVLAMLNRESYWQLGYVIQKGGIEIIQKNGLQALRDAIAEVAPFLKDRVARAQDLGRCGKLLTVAVDRLREWYKPGFVCIGDAAHAMSPIGGVGINLAIQDAVASANILAGPLKQGTLSTKDLKNIQRRRISSLLS